MDGYWIKFTDGTRGYCEGQGAFDAVQIAEKVSGKKVDVPEADRWKPKLQRLPYPANPVIWQFDHPVHGKCPPLCSTPAKCVGNTSCPKSYACSE